MANIDIRPVRSKKDLMAFIKLPWKIYANDPYWVPPLIMDRKKVLDKKKNPFYKHNPTEFFLAYKNGEVVGRIAAIYNKQHNEFHQDKVGFFGFLEGINDRQVFERLLETVKDWLRQYDRDYIMGPMNPSTNDEIGFLYEGFEYPPFFMMTHNPPYYIDLMNELGYEKVKDVWAYLIDKEHLVVSEKLKRVSQAVLKKLPVTIRSINMKDFRNELEIIRDIYNNAWSRNWGFVPLSPDEFDFIANDFKQIVDEDLVLIAEFRGKPVGFMLAMPNYNEVFKKIKNGRLFPFGWLTFLLNRKKIKGIRVITLGIKHEYQPYGLGSVFYTEIIQRGLAKGYDHAEMSWILEDNDLMNRSARLLGGWVYKRYRIFGMPL